MIAEKRSAVIIRKQTGKVFLKYEEGLLFIILNLDSLKKWY